MVWLLNDVMMTSVTGTGMQFVIVIIMLFSFFMKRTVYKMYVSNNARYKWCICVRLFACACA